MVAAMVCHLRSLRGLKHDHECIDTLLEEAENEQMWGLVCHLVVTAGWHEHPTQMLSVWI
jgi:Alternative oxidase